MPDQQSSWRLCSAQGARLEMVQPCNIRLTTKMKIFNTVAVRFRMLDALATDLKKLEVFQMSCLRQILGVTRRDRLRNDTIRHRCKKQPTVGKWIQWNRLRWFGHVCRMDENAFYGQNVQMVGVVLPTHPRNNGKTTSLLTSRRISPGASTVTPWRQ